jgi:hypothetical protein
VLVHTNATASPNGTYWIRAAIQSDMFTYDQPGQNTNIRGIIRFVSLLFSFTFASKEITNLGTSYHVRYSDAPSTGLPGDPASSDPGSGVNGLQDVDGTTVLNPLVTDRAPNSTRAYPVSFDFQNTPDNHFLGFMNTTVSRSRTLFIVKLFPTPVALVFLSCRLASFQPLFVSIFHR